VAVNKPVGDNARKGAVKKRTQLKTTLGGATTWTKRNKKSGEFVAVKKQGGQEIQRYSTGKIASVNLWRPAPSGTIAPRHRRAGA
jgi:hypothetical protein